MVGWTSLLRSMPVTVARFTMVGVTTGADGRGTQETEYSWPPSSWSAPSWRARFGQLRAALEPDAGQGANRPSGQQLILDVAIASGAMLLSVLNRVAVYSSGWYQTAWWLSAFVIVAPIALLVRRRYPAHACAVLALASLCAYIADTGSWPLLLSLSVALYSVAVWRNLAFSLTTVVLVLGMPLAVTRLSGTPLEELIFRDLRDLGDVGVVDVMAARTWPLSLSLLLGFPYVVGLLVRLQRRTTAAAARAEAAVARGKEQQEVQAMLTERAGIARDLHDVVAHHVNLMVIQAETGPDLVRRGQDDVLRGFERIGDAGRRALGELDRMLYALRDTSGSPALAPQPSLADIPTLVADFNDQGIAAELEIRGEVESVADGPGLAAYRVVQEALTNVLRHANADSASVLVDVQSDGISVEVTDDGGGFDPAAARSEGRHGLTGMRERVRVHQGTLAVASRPGGGTAISAWLPVTDADEAGSSTGSDEIGGSGRNEPGGEAGSGRGESG